MERKLRPLGDGVLVRLAKADDRSAGGIIIPEANKERPRRGEVLAVGPGRAVDAEGGWRQPVEVKPGNEVLFGAFVGTQVGEEEDLLLLKESDILAVILPRSESDGPPPPLAGPGEPQALCESGPPSGGMRKLPDGRWVSATTGVDFAKE